MLQKVFFAEEGLTSVSANHIANLAKEYIQSTENELENLQFFTEEVTLIGNPQKTILRIGNTQESLNTINEKIASIAEAKSLIAWLREAIKEKEKSIKALKQLTIEDYCKIEGISIPKRPEREELLTEEKYYDSLSVKERNKYYSLETVVSTLGKVIHPNGCFSNARKQLKDKSLNPNKVIGSGRDAVVYSYTPTILEQDVEDKFFELQSIHRDAQRNLNSMKAKCQQAIQQQEAEIEAKFTSEYSAYKLAVEQLDEKVRVYKIEKSNEIASLKIIIPNDLKEIYELISSLG